LYKNHYIDLQNNIKIGRMMTS